MIEAVNCTFLYTLEIARCQFLLQCHFVILLRYDTEIYKFNSYIFEKKSKQIISFQYFIVDESKKPGQVFF